MGRLHVCCKIVSLVPEPCTISFCWLSSCWV
uniref:Uncharacterized protein n=1 Tax=Arundo donax TaxID=35708 RepID=A0A0A9EGB5_ARUDO